MASPNDSQPAEDRDRGGSPAGQSDNWLLPWRQAESRWDSEGLEKGLVWGLVGAGLLFVLGVTWLAIDMERHFTEKEAHRAEERALRVKNDARALPDVR